MKRTIAGFVSPFTLRPTPFILSLIGTVLLISLCIGLIRVFASSDQQSLIQQASNAWYFLIAGLGCFAVYDWFVGVPIDKISTARELPNSFALNRSQDISFVITNTSTIDLDISFHDSTPSQFQTAQFPLKQTVRHNQKGIFNYQVVPKSRGLANFEPAYVLITSRFRLWQFIARLGGQDQTKVYPDFSAISNSFIFGVEQAMRNMGAHIAKHKGDGMEFNQLREFRVGDTLKQIDWKATARLGEPISREYQEEKDQNVIFLLDCSRRMRAIENNLSYFDYALNALLLSSYIALDKGDAVGVMTFSGTPSWLPPIKGKTAVNTILNHLYDLNTSTQSSDYVSAAEELLVKHRKRSLIILLTNVRDEDNEDLNKAVDILRGQHLVMIVTLKEHLVQNVNDLPGEQPADALLYAGTKLFEQHRDKMLARLRASGTSVVDATHKDIHIKLVTEYLSLKQRGHI